MDEKGFQEALKKSQVPILVLDQKWHRLFAISGKPEEVKILEVEENELFALQGKLSTELKELKKSIAREKVLLDIRYRLRKIY